MFGERWLDTVGVFSPGLLRLRGLKAFVGARRVLFRPRAVDVARLDAVLGWGRKATADTARAFARRHGVPYLALEDGFLRSMGVGAGEPPLSLVVDELGIYYDARGPSRLEAMLAFRGPGDPLDDPELLARAAACRRRILEARLSKYNHTPAALPSAWKRGERPQVLVVDQTFDDASVSQGLANAATFDDMLETARAEHPEARIVVKVHPATALGHKRGYLAGRTLPADVERLAEPVNPILLVEQMDHVYVCSSQLGFEALMVGKPVTCFGAPFYAGWELTRDRLGIVRRGRPRSIDALVAAALLLYPRYLDPISGERCSAEEIIEHLALQRRMRERDAVRYYCLGFSIWKRPFVRRYLSGAERIRFVRSRRQLEQEPLEEGAAVVVWGSARRAPAARFRSGRPVPVWRMEDGFLRSVKLGSQLTPPGSLVLDRSGLYYDPSAPSDLERLLMETRFSTEDCRRAARLRQRIVELGVSKYNLAGARSFVPGARAGQPVVLVIGQVDDDASVRLGSPAVRSNLALLRAVRRLRPDAHLVYKPHPDVLSGNRRGRVEPSAEALWDEQVTDASVAACLDAADEVHTMTSLVGFEALLRGLKVVTHGQPFYAGWGLTEDRFPLARRTRRLSLDELVAGTLVYYPRYFSWQAQAFCTPEQMVDELARQRDRQRGLSFAAPWLVRRARDVAILTWEWLHA